MHPAERDGRHKTAIEKIRTATRDGLRVISADVLQGNPGHHNDRADGDAQQGHRAENAKHIRESLSGGIHFEKNGSTWYAEARSS